MRGRKPKPIHLRLLDGNAGHRPLNANAPDPSGNLNAAPDGLDETQRAIWDEAIAAAPTGLLRRLDASVLLVFVRAKDIYLKAAAKVDATGLVVKSGKGLPIQNPYLSVMNRQSEIMLKAIADMGFSPSSRSRVEVTGGKENGNRFARNGKRA